MQSYTKTLFLYQPNNGYCYNSDTHFLYNFIIQNLLKFKNIKGELLDIGSGSGVLGLMIARDFEKLNLNQSEIQPIFQFLSQKNSEVNKINNNLYKGNFLEYNFDKEFEYIVSNPPFYNSDVIKSEKENIKIARYNDDLPLNSFISKISKLLKSNGKLFFCYDVKQLNKIVISLDKYKLNIESIQFLHPKEEKEASLVMVYARKNSKSKLKIMNPLIMFDNSNNFKEQINIIYNTCSTHSIKCDIDTNNIGELI
ncbi:MAG: methyltransferase [Campylobacterota bacterium]|nr:methyltransferase [Campylobacterota bacterium]